MPAKSKVKPVAERAPRRRGKDEKAVVLSTKTAYKGKVFSVTTEKVTEPGGFTSTRDVIRHNGSVVVFAVDGSRHPDDPLVVIIRQYRHAAGQFLLEIPAGRIEPGEAPLAAAKRELMEETGVKAKKWSKLSNYYASPGFLGETMQIYLAQELTFGLATPEEDEKIELLHVPLSDLVEKVVAGEIRDGKTIVGTLLYDQIRRARS